MNDDILLKLITASVSPAVMISGTALMILGFLGRQGILTGRQRELLDKSLHHAELFRKEKDPYHAERSSLLLNQARAIHGSARNVKWTITFLLCAIIGFISTSICLGLSVLAKDVLILGAFLFIAGMVSLCIAVSLALSGVLKSLSPLQKDQEDAERMLKRFDNINK